MLATSQESHTSPLVFSVNLFSKDGCEKQLYARGRSLRLPGYKGVIKPFTMELLTQTVGADWLGFTGAGDTRTVGGACRYCRDTDEDSAYLQDSITMLRNQS